MSETFFDANIFDANVFDAIAGAFEKARERGLVHAADFRLAGGIARMEIVGDALADRILPPFSHLRRELQKAALPATDADEPLLAVRLWDASATGVGRPAGLPAQMRRDEWHSPSQRFAYSHDRRYAEYSSRAGVMWLDRAARRLYGCYDDARDFTIYDYSRPLPWLLPIWCNDLGVQCVHAGMVSWRGRGVLLAGKSGSGKTTVTLACLSEGFDYLAEDQVGLSEHEGRFQGHSLYNTARLEAAHLQRFPLLASRAMHETGEKTLLRLAELFPGQCIATAPLCAVLLPTVPAADASFQTILAPATSAEALRTIAANSLMLPMGGGRRGFERLSRLVQSVPCYRLQMGRELRGIPDAIREMLESEAPESKAAAPGVLRA